MTTEQLERRNARRLREQLPHVVEFNRRKHAEKVKKAYRFWSLNSEPTQDVVRKNTFQETNKALGYWR